MTLLRGRVDYDWNLGQRVDLADAEQMANSPPVIKLLQYILFQAIRDRASDIHLEPFEDEMRIRYRIDGVLQEVPVPAQIKRFQPAIVSRVKILSHLNIAEKRLPQDGRIKVRIEDAEEAHRIDERIAFAWRHHPNRIVIPATDAFEHKLATALGVLRDWLPVTLR